VTPPGRSWQMIRPGSEKMTGSLTANASGKVASLAVRLPSARHDESRQSLGRRTAPTGARRDGDPDRDYLLHAGDGLPHDHGRQGRPDPWSQACSAISALCQPVSSALTRRTFSSHVPSATRPSYHNQPGKSGQHHRRFRRCRVSAALWPAIVVSLGPHQLVRTACLQARPGCQMWSLTWHGTLQVSTRAWPCLSSLVSVVGVMPWTARFWKRKHPSFQQTRGLTSAWVPRWVAEDLGRCRDGGGRYGQP
jgi:hypothetical protein